ncbi:hypothetical protein BC832DRAFT_560807 [Gaertneriomyces semiglobifer]|nr:hypothetical protein BC832DRAFT_560807 [Gaertneriomyces semiglobifer]
MMDEVAIEENVVDDDCGSAGCHPHRNGRLPPELLSKIFRLCSPLPSDENPSSCNRDLTNIALACRSWYFPAVSELWRAPRFASINEFVMFVKRCWEVSNHLRHGTNATGQGDDGPAGWYGIKSLRSFTVTQETMFLLNAFILDRHISMIADAQPTLRHLTLHSCRSISDASLLQLVSASRCTLRTLDLSHSRVSDLCVQLVLGFCEGLKEIRLSGVGKLSDDTVAMIPDVEVLHINKCPKVGEVGLMTFLAGSKRLRELRFGKCDKITRTVSLLAPVYVSMVHSEAHIIKSSLTLSFELQDSRISWTSFPTYLMANITSLHVHNPDNIPLNILHPKPNKLTQLSLHTGVVDTTSLQEFLSRCHNLSALCLTTLHGVTNVLLQHIPQCPFASSLQILDISGCRQISDAGIAHLGGFEISQPTQTLTLPTIQWSTPFHLPLPTMTTRLETIIVTTPLPLPSLATLHTTHVPRLKWSTLVKFVQVYIEPHGVLSELAISSEVVDGFFFAGSRRCGWCRSGWRYEGRGDFQGQKATQTCWSMNGTVLLSLGDMEDPFWLARFIGVHILVV